MTEILRAPFPWFGGKRKAASLVWARLGQVVNYVEPFFGSGAVLLGRPAPFDGVETVNDLDGLLANFWRSVRLQPEVTAEWADSPVNENDLHARHVWLLSQRDSLRPKLEGDPDYCDPKIAGWWVWGLCCWIGSGWCSGRGPWVVDADRKLVHLGGSGQGVNRKLVHLGNNGRGVNRKLVHLGDSGQGDRLRGWFLALSQRLASVRVASGDWSRVCSPSVTSKHGLTGVFLDPPYGGFEGLYREETTVARAVARWARENGDSPLLRIALCGYEGEHEMPPTWECVSWDAGQGFGGQAAERSENGKRERVWFSPHCLKQKQGVLF